ncbi:alpha/beta fold hydrolase [Sphingomonas humi]|uniref:alpha/beta fold hydrolase n=1 Tax=Sphingomonas humi TaxID=335630 RepID=UPI0031DF6828
MANDVAPPDTAPQQSRGPRPLPLFLALLREAALQDPDLARTALEGLRRYQSAPAAAEPAREKPVLFRQLGASLRDCGGTGPTLVLIPSLINPPTILDLDPQCSLANALATRHRVLMLDWGTARSRREFDLDDHVEHLLLPLLQQAGAATLAGYCLGGTLALAAATRSKQANAVVTLASPYDFSGYPAEARERLLQMWQASEQAAQRFGFLPMEVLQSAFWQIDPARLVGKFAKLARAEPASPETQRFVRLEEWANAGEPLPLLAARQLVERLFGEGRAFSPLPSCPMLHVTASGDRIVPAGTAAPGERLSSPSGHVGMIVGRDAARTLHQPLLSWLEGAAAGG